MATGTNMFMPEPVRDDIARIERARAEKQAKILAGVAKKRQRLLECAAEGSTYDADKDVCVPAKAGMKKIGKQKKVEEEEFPFEAEEIAAPFVYKLVDYLSKEFALPERDKNLLLKELDEIEFYKARNRRAVVQELEISEEEKEAGREEAAVEREEEAEAAEAAEKAAVEREEQAEEEALEGAPAEEEREEDDLYGYDYY
jgi:hypothetical protein